MSLHRKQPHNPLAFARRSAIAQTIAVFTGLLGSATGPALAQGAASVAPPTSTPKPSDTSAELPTVVITGSRGSDGSLQQPTTAGSRLDLTPMETPASVAVVPGDRIRTLGVNTVLEAKTLAPGITSSNGVGNGGNVLNARGFTGQNSVKQLYNGLEIFNAGGVVSFPFDPWNVDRVEALYGPASVLYGTGAIGGAVNVVPKRPDPTQSRTEVLLGIGSYGARQQAIGSTGPLGDMGNGLSYRIDLSQRSADNWVDRTDSSSTAASAALRYDASSRLRFILSADYGKQRPMHYLGTPVLNGAPVPGTERKNYNIADSDLFFKDKWLTLETDWVAGDGVTVNNKTYSMHHDRRYRDVTVFTFQPASNTVRRTGYRDIARAPQRQVGTQTTVKMEGTLAGRKNNFLVGFDANRSTYDREDNVRGGTSVVDAFNPVPGQYRDAYLQESRPVYHMTLNQVGLFAENRLTLSEQLSAVIGLRADQYRNDREDRLNGQRTQSQLDALSGSFGLVYNPQPNWSVYGQVATASDPVNSLASIGADQQGFNLSKGRQVELGVKQATPDGRFEWTLATYHLVKKDLLTPSLANPSISEQVGQQSSRGLEASVSAKLGAWQVVLNGTVLDPQFDDFSAQSGASVILLAGKVPTNVHKRAANLLVFWDMAPGWKANGALRYVGERFTNNTNTASMPSYSVVNLGLSWAATPQVRLDLQLENVFDKVYATQGSTTQWVLGRPRALWVSGTYAF
ncbi:MAG: TonB-dependent receptor [Hydrogenophaga sp.]|uniref:TonB-dependent receptor n=1 Tax=Hydrogenophaga sp. TaxID=1904254 RepID=UPI002ABADB7E|nr:TonB-dependent receptor [Hydrogenophaga sp.]MDZ4282954.1 TonB-dependent receptor [Hydrogenophaga sp.]